ncbi:MAG: PIG-L family deacetylase, partial [Flavobacteriaceae bacterium]|nr:PIG-L family deacetylase [Flavobacteriaceae bacterium]
MRFLRFVWLISCCLTTVTYSQQPQKPTSSEILHNLKKLNFLGSALYIAAHPDDENTRLISYLANDVHARTAYLSLTRGDGGQNLVGPEIRELLGVIRTQELLAARRIDGGSQLFTRANDFGYSKHPDETLSIWNKTEVLSDVVRAIRKFKPDVIINRFDHRNPGTTHGHHTSSAMLSFEAFDLVNDASIYPETAKTFGTWQPKRLFFNTSWWFYGSRENFEKADKTNLVEVETGNYYPLLGLSNGEIAALSRSMHKSQGFGSTGSRGSETEYLEFLKGDFPQNKSDLFDGIDTSWSRIEGGAAIGEILYAVEKNFNMEYPSSMLPELTRAYELLKNIENDHWRTVKMKQLEQLILDAGGIFIEAVASENTINPKGEYEIQVELINRGSYPVVVTAIHTASGKLLKQLNTSLAPNEKNIYDITITSESRSASTPYWLNKAGTLGMYDAPKDLIGTPETPNPELLKFELQLSRTAMDIVRPVVYKFNDPVAGEVYRPLEVVPAVTSSITEKVLIFADDVAKQVPVTVKAGRDLINGSITLQHPEGWMVTPAQHIYELSRKGETQTVMFTVTPPEDQNEGELRPLVQLGDEFFDKELVTLDYDHLPYQHVLLPSQAKVVRIPIEKRGERIGYIEGAGDAIPESLKQIGYQVTTLTPEELQPQALQNFDAIVVGIRAYNTVPELAFKKEVLHSYVENGGTLILQYNTSRGLVTDELAPYPLSLSRERVTDEFSEVRILSADHTV